MLALVGHGQPFARMVLGLPCRGQFGADAFPTAPLLGQREVGVDALQHQFRHPLLFAQHGPARRFRRVRGEHRIDAQPLQHLANLGGGIAIALQSLEAIGNTTGLRVIGVVQVLPAAARPVHFLGEVHYLKPGREGAGKIAGRGGGATTGPLTEVGSAVRVSLAATDGGDTVTFHALEKFFSALLAQDFPYQAAKRVDILPQGRVLRGELDVLPVNGHRREFPSRLP